MWGFFRQAPVVPAESSKSGTVTSISAADNRMRVHFQATEWFAFAEQPWMAQPGDLVQIMGRVNATTLLVQQVGASMAS
ncbi:MAG: hypothetical protein WBA10_03385 [Elainellaceae cyanobacterium]